MVSRPRRAERRPQHSRRSRARYLCRHRGHQRRRVAPGATLGATAFKIFLAGFIASTVPPFLTWALGYRVFKISPAVLMSGAADARSHSGPCREATKEINSSVPWVGFPAGFVAALLPHALAILAGRYVLKMNPLILLGACSGAGMNTASLRAVQDVAQSKLPALGYAVPCAVGNTVLAAWVPVIVALLSVGK